MRGHVLGIDFELRNSLYGATKLTANTNPEKYKYSCYGIGFDGPGFRKNVIIFGPDMSPLVHIDSKKRIY